MQNPGSKNHKIAFLTSSHNPHDDRIFYHFAQSLLKQKYLISVVCSTCEIVNNESGIDIVGFDGSTISKKIKIDRFTEILLDIKPQIIICLEPITILAAVKYRNRYNKNTKIIYDITEWYPSKTNLYNKAIFAKWISFVTMFFFNIYAASKVNGFIFGEKDKRVMYKLFFPFRAETIISYYPDLKYIQNIPVVLNSKEFCIGYTGKINSEKGIFNILNALKILLNANIDIQLKIKIIGWFPSNIDKTNFYNEINKIERIHLEILELQEYKNLASQLADVNLFLDLRKIDFENSHSLPIKIFFYAAMGRPVIYSNLSAIRKNIDIEPFGYLVNPEDPISIGNHIKNYIQNDELYTSHCINARNIAEQKYCWGKIEPQLFSFIQQFID